MTDKEIHSREAPIVQKQAEEALARSEALLNEVQEVSRVGGWEYDIQTRHLTWTDEVYRIHELPPDYDPNDIANDIHFYLRDDQARIEEAFDRAVTVGESYDLELQFMTAKGNHRWVRTMGRPELKDGHPTRVVGNITDITDRKQAEEALRESEENFRHFLDDSPLGVRIVTAEGETMYANRAILDIYGFSSLEELRTTPVEKRYTSESYIEFKKRYERRQQGEDSPSEYEVNVVRKNGEVRHLLVSRKGQLWNGKKQYQLLYRDITERKQAEDKLQVAQLQWSQFLEASPDPMWIKDPSGRYVAASKTYFHVDPSAEGNIIGKTDAECFPPEKAAVYVADDRVAIETGASEGEFTAVGDDGKLRTFLTKKVVLRAPDGSVAGTLGVSRDITDRKQAEEALLQARDDWESTFDALTDMVTIHDKNFNIVRANSSARRMLQLPLSGNLTNAKCFMCYHGTEKPPEGCPSCRSLVTEQPCSSEFFEPHLNRHLEIRAIPRFDTHHQCIGLVHVVRDITERKQAEEETQRERAFFDQLVETAPEGIAIADTQGRIMRVNAEFVRMFGYGVDEVVGQCLDDLVAPPARQEEARALTRSTVQGGKNLLETVRCRKDGTLVDVSLIGASILVAGKPEALYAIYRDITERKQAEAQLRQSQKIEAIGTLAGGVAHDFNNLLTGILGNIALMRGSLPPADPLLENLAAAETAARQAADLTKGLLTFSRRAMVSAVPLDMAEAVDTTLTILKQSLPATMDIIRDVEQPAWTVLLDRSQLTQILLNLAVNARDAMKGKGTLTIRTRNVTIDTAYVHEHFYARTGEFIHLSVTDTGPGMSSEVMQHLFEPFYTTKPIGSGTGLGLSVVYGAVKQADGWITAVSTEGVGTTFDIYLPRCLEEPMHSFTPSPLSVNVHGGTVLVVEDEPVVRTVTQALLSRSGYTVLTALDGASALNVLRDHPVGIGLILLDMTMPGMTTSEIVRAIRALDPTAPILLNSGYTSNGAVKQMLEENSVQGFLGKPYDLDQLLGKVQELLHRS
ncbi:PAS domain-containing sensor histidine kinase [Candidatus Cryosericum septentrionale]|nr:PAS domain-containing sensor histidine kinase [Candidatus Cryosericum septentrionale]